MCDKCKDNSFQCICGRLFEKKTSLMSHHGHCKVYQELVKEEKLKWLEEHKPTILPNGKYLCLNTSCNKEHDGSYGSGRFCCKECKIEYIASTKRGVKNPKVKAHLDKLISEGKICVKAQYGTWKCEKCNLIFETRSKLDEHKKDIHKILTIIKNDNGMYECPYCKKEFGKSQAAKGHITNCPKHPDKEKHDLSHKQASKTYSENIKSGKTINGFKGKHHTAKAKENMRKAACEYLKSNNATPCRYNKSSIQILEQIAKEHGWNIQHAENGGEFYTGIGYWLDAYDKEKNIVLEYDEPIHYVDAENNLLRLKDLERLKLIIEHLHCEYWRYNEKTKVLWKVE